MTRPHPPRGLALFDLDHTLIPFDSGMAWTRFLIDRGVLAAEAEARYLAYCHQYVAGTLDIHAMHRANMAPLRHHARAELAEWAAAFGAAIAPRLPRAARALVERHRHAGDLCAIVTATTELIAAPIARAFGIADLVATRAATASAAPDAPYTGEIDGLPCYREHKLARVGEWLASRPGGDTDGRLAIVDFAPSWFYSDSRSDLPLMRAVSNPVAVQPDAELSAHAAAAGWPVITLGD